MTTPEKTPEQRVEELNRAFGSSTGDRPHFKAEHEGDEYLFARRPRPKHRAFVTLLARVGDSDVLNEIATIGQTLEVEAITDETRREGESETAVARVTFNLAAALRAAAAEVDAQQREQGARDRAGTVYLDPATGETYHLRGYVTDWSDPGAIDPSFPPTVPDYLVAATEGMSVAGKLPEGAYIIWEPSA